jgi:molecular chaperone DnaK
MTSGSENEPKRIPLRVRLPFATEAEFIERYGANVTRGGIFIATRSGKPAGTLLSFELVLQDGARLMRGEGVVEQASDEAEGARAGMLVRFTRIDARTKALIDAIAAVREGHAAAEPPATQASPAPAASRPSPAPSASPAPLPMAQPSAVPSALADDVVLGIDLGTTTCRAAVVLEGEPVLIPIPSERGSFALPSAVAWEPSKERLLVGSAAKKHRVEHPEQSVLGFKRLMGRRAQSKKVRELAKTSPYVLKAAPSGDVGVELSGRTFALPEFAALLLQELKNAAQDFLQRPLTRAVLCVPAWYSDHQRAAVLEAGELAGLEVLTLLNEPSAIALAFGFGRGLARKRVLVYDLGGGTFDASVVEITGDDIEAVSTGGDNFLGGMDFDERLGEALISTLPEGPRDRLLASKMAVERVRDAAELAKIKLSEAEVTPVHVPFATTDESDAPVDLRAEVERSFLESATADLVERTAQVTQVVMEAARLTPQALDEVLLVGGQSRSPAIRRRIEALLGRPGRTDVDPAGAVALGAALLGHSLVQRERGKRGLALSEVLASPIGVAVRGGGFRRILERNTRLPANKAISVRAEANQPLRFAVFQGAAARAEDNEYLGALTVVSDRPGDVTVRFAVSADGRLTASAATPTGKEASATFSTADASDEVCQQLFAESPLPGEDEERPASTGLFGGLKRLFGR